MDKEFFDSESPDNVGQLRRQSINDATDHIMGELHQLKEYVRKNELPAVKQTLREIIDWCRAIEADLK